MFKDRAIQLTVVKKPTTPGAPVVEDTSASADDIAQIVMYHAGHATKLVVGGIAIYKLLDTASQVAVIAAKAHFEK